MTQEQLQEVLLTPWMLGLVGLCIGSFLNVVIHRLPLMLEREWWVELAENLGNDEAWRRLFGPAKPIPDTQRALGKAMAKDMESLPSLGIATPRSRCPACGHQIRWHENIPVLGYLRLGGKCAACKALISPRYPIVEVFTGLLFAAIAWKFGAHPTTLLWCGFAATLIALSGIDWDTTYLPDILTQPLLWAGIVAAAMNWTIPLAASLWGAVAGYMSLWVIAQVFMRVTGKQGMANGDFKLLAALGAWLGLQMLLPVVLAASVIGAVAGLIMKVRGTLRDDNKHVPFGPFLAGAGLVVMMAGSQRVLEWMGWA